MEWRFAGSAISSAPLEAALIPFVHCYIHRLWAVRRSRGPHLDLAIVGADRQACAIYPDLHGRRGGAISRRSLDPGSTLGGCPVEGPTPSVADGEGSTRVPAEATNYSSTITPGRDGEFEPCPTESDSGGRLRQALRRCRGAGGCV
jgi:hypothetical protein